ncbi:radical SAM protein [Roseiconus nitratireducens]|nr:radical SAM protein [Roseiconus nitratireducens]
MKISLPVLNLESAQPSDLPLTPIRTRLQGLSQRDVVVWFELRDSDRLLKTTISLCPSCLRHVPAAVYTADGRVWIKKQCPEHGLSEAVIENDEQFYFLSNKDCCGKRYRDDRLLTFPTYQTGCCGGDQTCGDGPANASDPRFPWTDQSQNKSCTVLVEITNACNLSCKVCYSDARGDRVLSLDAFRSYMTQLIHEKNGLDSVQLTGGEALLHPQFWEMIGFLNDQPGVRKIYLPTNGLLLDRPEVAQRLVPFRDKLMVLLQFDGHSADANLNLRAANPTHVRERVIQRLEKLGIVMQLTMTLTRGVNDAEVGWVIDTAMRHSHIKLVALQPVTYSGRYQLAREPIDRLTLSDVVKCVTSQAATRIRDQDFVPIPCSHPNCGWLTLFVRRRALKFNVTRHVDLARVTEQVAYKTILDRSQIRKMVGSSRPQWGSRLLGAIGRRLVRPTDLFGIAIKPFMDCYNYDQDRIANCCHHLMDTHGRAVSFCEYNALLRERDPWSDRPRLE